MDMSHPPLAESPTLKAAREANGTAPKLGREIALAINPVIELGVEVYRIVDESIAVLAKPEAGVYVRAGKLVRVVRDVDTPGVERAAGALSIRPLCPASLLDLLTRHGRWGQFDARSDKIVAKQPPKEVIAGVLARGSWPGVRPLVGVLDTPALRPDGSILQTNGYDEVTGYLLELSSGWPRDILIPDAPTLEDAQAAAVELLAVVKDFPFATPAHAVAWLAGLLTLFARPAIDGCCPLIAIDATTPRTGKGRLIDTMVNIATGRDASKTTLPKDEEEFRKRITALILEGELITVLDNVKGMLNSATLDGCLTSTRWKDRLLGVTGMIEAENRLVWAVTVNNLQFGADTAHRSLYMRLESKLEHPEARTDFEHPRLLAWVRANRPRLVYLALLILRAHAVAGRPRCGAAVMGGFEPWSEIVPSAVAWCTGLDPQSTRVGLVELGDQTTGTLGPLLAGLERLGGPKTARGILGALYPAPATQDGYEDLRTAIEELCPASTTKGGAPAAKSFGQALRRLRGRVQGGLHLDATPVSGTLWWRVAGASASPATPEAPTEPFDEEEAQGAFDGLV